MFKTMRRKNKRLTEEETIGILEACEEGVLATVGEDGYPYAVPLNYVYHRGAIYFHCALSGHKIENMAFNPRVSFCVTGEATIVPEEFNTLFKSAVVFGKAQEVTGEEKNEGLMALIRRLAPDHVPAGEKYIGQAQDKTRVFKIVVEHLSGKAGS